ncbi:MAG: FtsX-like permease family protein [Mycobacteriales bacterium]
MTAAGGPGPPRTAPLGTVRLGVRLTVSGGREAASRLVVIAAAVAVGVGLLLMALAGINAVNSQNARYAWLATSALHHPRAGHADHDPLWGIATADSFHGKDIVVVEVAAAGPNPPVPPGIPHLPGPGEYYASPSLGKLLRSTPAAQLADRYPGRQVGTIGAAALPAPDSLIVVIGYRVEQLAHRPGAAEVTSLNTTPPNDCSDCPSGVGINANGMDVILFVVAGALLFPVLIFIGLATRLSAARREQRFAVMRLAGATPRQISVISTVESSLASAVGTAVGFGVYLLLRHPMASISFTGARFFPADLSLNTADILAVALGVPAAAAVAARLALRRVNTSPLGVSRRVTPRPPRAYRLVPLVAGLAELGYFVVVGRPETTAGQVQAYMGGLLLTMGGLIFAGPWLTMVGSRLLVRRTSRPAFLIAGRRLSDNPQAGFRTISGLVLALFVTSTAAGVITTYVAYRGAPAGTQASASTVEKTFDDDYATARIPGQPLTQAVPDQVLRDLAAIPGVRGVAVIRADPDAPPDPNGPPWGLASCAELRRIPALGHCPAGADTVRIADVGFGDRAQARTAWPASAVPPATLKELPARSVTVGTNGSHAAIERARTVLERFDPHERPPRTIGEFNENGAKQVDQYRQLANVVILTSLPIAGCSLAVSVAAGIGDRRRPFSMLRLAGVPLGTLRRVIALESAVPLLLAAIVATGTGFAAAQLFLRSQLGYTLHPPGLEYYLVLLAGLLMALAVIASTLPLLDRVTGPEAARND